ncbi:MAG: AmmeMemoRadiSam system protein B [Candidatus Omnitrophica bacterium]|nr:AmmeMemoRadiSam system protein B [Candidatus Omnitrophota bacterium]
MASCKIRLPVVAGQFYSSSAVELKQQLEESIDRNAIKIDAIACMLPHAGYIYSGAVAGQTVSCINIKDRVILLGPNHTGLGGPFSIMTGGVWKTPLGGIEIDSGLAKAILNGCRYLDDDELAHLHEHSLEVELPFLQYFKTDFKIVPIAFSSGDISTLKDIGRDIAETIKSKGLNDSVLLLASSDMTHYEPESQARKKDNAAIEAILELNEDRLMKNISRLDISMCGYAPAITMLSAAKALGATKAELVKYQTSGDVTGDKNSVVGYAGIIIS